MKTKSFQRLTSALLNLENNYLLTYTKLYERITMNTFYTDRDRDRDRDKIYKKKYIKKKESKSE